MTRLNPSEVRQRILDQHDALRVHLDALQAALEASTPSDVLKASAAEVQEELVRHIADEEALLLPELREADGFGDVRVEALQKEHAEQRELLRTLVDAIKGSESENELRGRIDELIRRIRTDMDEEEKTHLTRKVLKDDVIIGDPGD